MQLCSNNKKEFYIINNDFNSNFKIVPLHRYRACRCCTSWAGHYF